MIYCCKDNAEIFIAMGQKTIPLANTKTYAVKEILCYVMAVEAMAVAAMADEATAFETIAVEAMEVYHWKDVPD